MLCDYNGFNAKVFFDQFEFLVYYFFHVAQLLNWAISRQNKYSSGIEMTLVVFYTFIVKTYHKTKQLSMVYIYIYIYIYPCFADGL